MASNYSMSQFDSLNANQQNEIRRIATENANDKVVRDTQINDAMKLYTTPAQPTAPVQPPAPVQPQPQQPQAPTTVSDGTGNTVQVQQGAQAPATPAQYPTVQNANIDNKAPQASGTSTTQTPSPSASKTQQPEPPKVLTQDEVFNSVISGTALPDNVKRSPLYREVMKRKSNVDMVNAMSAEDLVLAEKAGSISGSALNDLRLVNPAKYAQFTQVKERRTKMDQINTTTNAGFNIVSGGLNSNVSASQQYADAVTASIRKTEEETMKKLQAMSDQFAKKGEEYERKFADVVRNDQAVKEGLADLRKKKEDLTNVDAQIAKVGADVRAELAGKGVPDSYIYAVIAQRTKDLNAQRTAAATVYNGALDMLNADLDMASGQYDAFIKGEGVAQSFANKLYDSQESAYDKSLGFATSAASKVFGDMQSIAQNEAEFNQKIDQQAKVASDPVMATQSMIDEFKKINVLANRSDAEIIADVKNKVASGMSIGQALSELKAAYMSKPEYKEWARANQTGQVTEREKLEIQQKNELQRMGIQNAYDLKKLATQQQYNNLVSEKDQMKFYQDMLNSGATVSGARAALRAITGDWKGASGKELADAPDGTIIPSRLAQTTNPNGGMECAEWTNASYGTTFPSSYQGKLNMATESEGGVGKAMVWKPSNDPRFAQYGHVGVIIGEQGDNWIVKSSNLRGDGHISVDVIPKSTQAQFKTLAGFGGQTAEQPIVTKKGDTQTQNQRIATMENARKVIMDKLGGKNFDTVVTAANDIAALGKSPNATDKMAVIFKFMKSLDPTSTVRETEYQAAASALGLEGTYESFIEGLKGKNIDPNLMDKYALTAITTALVSARDYKSKRDAVINSYAGMGADVSAVEDLTKVQGMKDVGKEASVLLGKLIDSKQITAQQAEDFLDKFGEFME